MKAEDKLNKVYEAQKSMYERAGCLFLALAIAVVLSTCKFLC